MNHPAQGQLYIVRYLSPIYGRVMEWSRIRISPSMTEHELQASIDRLGMCFLGVKALIFWANPEGLWEEIHLNPTARKYSLFSED